MAAFVSLAPRAEAAIMLAPTDIRPKDFAFIKKDGVYHLFYIRHNDFLPAFATENDFGHAISTDLYHWQQLPPVLSVNPFGWDNFHVWAPHIIQKNGLYWMYYTGITESSAFNDTQRIGLAVSSDLMTWTRFYDRPVWDTATAPWAWWNPQRASVACRDAFVMPDPALPGQYLMYYTATPATDTLVTQIGVARTRNGSLDEWEDLKPLLITHRSFSFNTSTESPHLFQHNGRWFMFITTNAGQPLSFFTTANPTGDPSEWIYRGRLRNMLGFDTSLWFASEYLTDGENDLFAFASVNRIEIRRIVWGTGDNFTLTEPSFFHIVSMDWTRKSVRAGDPVGLDLVVSNPLSFQQDLEAFVLDKFGVERPAPLDSLGLARRPALVSDTTRLQWFARRWPSTLPADEPMRVRIALDDGTASTPWLTVAYEPRSDISPGNGRTFIPDTLAFEPGEPEPEPLSTAIRPGGTRLAAKPPLEARTLPNSPVGLAISFELAEAADVRAEIFDLQGRRVRDLADRRMSAGAQVLPWDGRDANGVRLGRGLYFARVRSGEHVSSTRVLLGF